MLRSITSQGAPNATLYQAPYVAARRIRRAHTGCAILPTQLGDSSRAHNTMNIPMPLHGSSRHQQQRRSNTEKNQRLSLGPRAAKVATCKRMRHTHTCTTWQPSHASGTKPCRRPMYCSRAISSWCLVLAQQAAALQPYTLQLQQQTLPPSTNPCVGRNTPQ